MIKSKKCFLKNFFVVVVMVEWRQNVLESSHLNTRRRLEHSINIGHRKIICGDVTRNNFLLASNRAIVYEI